MITFKLNKAFNKTVLFFINTCKFSFKAVAKATDCSKSSRGKAISESGFFFKQKVKNINVEDLFIYFSLRNKFPFPPSHQVKGNIALSAVMTKVAGVPEEPFKIIRNIA